MNFSASLLVNVDSKLYPCYTTLSIFYGFAAILSVALNLLIGVAMIKHPSLWKPSMLLLGNLVATDFLSGLVIHPCMAVINVTMRTKGVVFITAVGVIRSVFFYVASVSLCTVAGISIDRLLAIRLKMNYRSVVTKKRVGLCIVTVWVSLGVGILIKYFVTDFGGGVYGLVIPVGGSVLLAITSFCYGSAFHTLKKTEQRIGLKSEPSETAAQSPFNVTSYRKSFYTMFAICLILVISYLPYFCSIVTSLVYDHTAPLSTKRRQYVFFAFTEVIIAYNSVINPVFYLLRMNDVRCAVKAILSKMFSD